MELDWISEEGRVAEPMQTGGQNPPRLVVRILADLTRVRQMRASADDLGRMVFRKSTGKPITGRVPHERC